MVISIVGLSLIVAKLGIFLLYFVNFWIKFFR